MRKQCACAASLNAEGALEPDRWSEEPATQGLVHIHKKTFRRPVARGVYRALYPRNYGMVKLSNLVLKLGAWAHNVRSPITAWYLRRQGVVIGRGVVFVG